MDREQLLNHIGEFLAEIGAEEGYLFGSRARGDELLESDVDLLIVSDEFKGVKFPRRLVMLQEHWRLPHFLEALPYTREELTRLSRSRGVIVEALRSGIRITPTSTRQWDFNKVIDWDEFQRPRKSERHIGDPKVYVGTTRDGLSLELPLECVRPFIQALPARLSVESVEIFAQDGNDSKEYSLTVSELATWLGSHANVLQEGTIMIEFGSHTLTSGGGGCLSLALDNASKHTLREIAREALTLCGFDHEFQGDEFSALVWKDQLEVGE